MANIHDGAFRFFSGREDNITGDEDEDDISRDLQNQDRNIGKTEAPIVVPIEDQYIIGNRINFLWVII